MDSDLGTYIRLVANEFALKEIIFKFENDSVLSSNCGQDLPSEDSSKGSENLTSSSVDSAHVGIDKLSQEKTSESLVRARKELVEVQHRLKDFTNLHPQFAGLGMEQNPLGFLMSDMANLFENATQKENLTEVEMDGMKVAYINETEDMALDRKSNVSEENIDKGRKAVTPEEHEKIMARLTELEMLEKAEQETS